MCYHIVVEREFIYVSKRVEKDKWDRISVPCRNVQNACAVERLGKNVEIKLKKARRL